MIRQVVVNGCSYMDAYCQGLGHVDLANNLEIQKTFTLALTGCTNSRIIRSTLKHSYTTDYPTLYVLGLTFMSRWELPINQHSNDFEGRWVNPQAREPDESWQFNWSESDTDTFKELQFKAAALSAKDQLEDLMYRLLSMLGDLRSRGHRAIIYNQADASIPEFSNNIKFKLMRSDPSFVNGLGWLAIPWQQEQGAITMEYPPERTPPLEFRHIAPGQHHYLNTYLTNYIQEHKILS